MDATTSNINPREPNKVGYRKLSDIIPALLEAGLSKNKIAKILKCDRSLVYFYARGGKKYKRAKPQETNIW